MSAAKPLDQVGSLKIKLGLLVGISVLVSTMVVALGGSAGVPWFLVVPIAVVLALAVTQLLAVGMTAPLREMTHAARQMAAGDYGIRIRSTANDEVGELARAFSAMAADLAATDAQRRDLVSTVAHELRTPLTALSAHMENMADGVIPADAAGIDLAVQQVERLRGLVRDLLDLSKIDAGAAALAVGHVPLQDLIQEVADSFDATIQTLVEPPTLSLVADSGRLRQVLTNLVDNAVRHSPPEGEVFVSAHMVGGRIRIEVADQGEGIAPADRERVFERFGTAEPGSGGTGLGLAIVRWIVTLHGGTVAAVEPVVGETGARIRVDLPLQPPQRPSVEHVATDVVLPQPRLPQAPSQAMTWPDVAPPRRGLALAGVGIGLAGGVLLPDRGIGLAWTLLILSAGAVVWVATAGRRTRFTMACAALCIPLALVPMLRDALWLTALAVLTSALLVVAGLTQGRDVAGFILGGIAWPASAIRGLPWIGRMLGRVQRGQLSWLRTAGLAVVGVLVFGGLLANGDAVMGHWVDLLVPDISWDADLVFRGFLAALIAGIVLTATYLALSPPTLHDPIVPNPARRRYEWLVPVLAIDLVFLIFVVAQMAAMFGGHAYIQRSTGLTYADYVHQGFGQLTVATMLTFLVLRVGLHKTPIDDRLDRAWARLAYGALCVLTLVVVASALYRMALYQEAYGYTVSRVLVDLFEAWLGLLIVFVLISGIRMNGRWLARGALLSGAAVLVVLAAVNPDAWIARHNIARADRLEQVDVFYLRTLSTDAVPTINEGLGTRAVCGMSLESTEDSAMWTDDAWSWNWGRSRAREVLAEPTPYPSALQAICSDFGDSDGYYDYVD